MKLRRWQQKVIDEFPSIIKSYRKFILKAPTGAGKTVLASEIINQFYKGKKIVVLCHRLVLLEQLEKGLSNQHKVKKFPGAAPTSKRFQCLRHCSAAGCGGGCQRGNVHPNLRYMWICF